MRLGKRDRDLQTGRGRYVHSILMSQDVFLKMMLSRYGGFGYSYLYSSTSLPV